MCCEALVCAYQNLCSKCLSELVWSTRIRLSLLLHMPGKIFEQCEDTRSVVLCAYGLLVYNAVVACVAADALFLLLSAWFVF